MGSTMRRCSRCARTTRCWNGLAAIDEMVGGTRYFEALKRIRALFPLEQAILAGASTTEFPFEAA